MSNKNAVRLCVGLLAWCLCVATARAQDAPPPDTQNSTAPGSTQVPTTDQPAGSSTQRDQPLPPEVSNSQENPSNSDAQNPGSHPIGDQQPMDVYRPLAGVQDQSIGEYPWARNYLVPSVAVNEVVDTNGLSQLGGNENGLASVTYLLGGLTLDRESARSRSYINYYGGRSFSPEGGALDSTVQELGASQLFRWSRSRLLFADQFSYLPESPFGFVGGEDIGALGLGGELGASFSVLEQAFLPNQSILTGRGTRISNTVATQYDYQTSARSSLTFAGGYGLLNFQDSGFINNWNFFFVGGYNYRITARNTVAVLYRYQALRFPGLSESINDNLVQMAYSRTITGKLAFQAAAGPEVDTFQGFSSTNSSRVSVGASATLAWQGAKTNLGISYIHGISAGSGLLTGAEADQVSGSVGRHLSRFWLATVGGGYAWNRAISEAEPGLPVLPSYQTYFATAQLIRNLGRNAAFSVGYTYQNQNSSVPACTTPGCQGVLLRQQIFITFGWHADPIRLQ
jgi:hypothetical protein